MSDPSCRGYRELLGVYVVGAIEPAERGAIEVHLSQCYECREELAGLALLPALLHRVPIEEAERLADLGSADADLVQPSAEVLSSLLRQVGARKRRRRVRAAFATAAAFLIAVGGTAAVTQALAPSPVAAPALDSAAVRSGQIGVIVHYGHSPWGTAMWVRVTGLRQWTACKFWVVTRDGHKLLAGGWIVGPGGDRLWYPVSVPVPERGLVGFVLTWGHQAVQIPVA